MKKTSMKWLAIGAIVLGMTESVRAMRAVAGCASCSAPACSCVCTTGGGTDGACQVADSPSGDGSKVCYCKADAV